MVRRAPRETVVGRSGDTVSAAIGSVSESSSAFHPGALLRIPLYDARGTSGFGPMVEPPLEGSVFRSGRAETEKRGPVSRGRAGSACSARFLARVRKSKGPAQVAL